MKKYVCDVCGWTYDEELGDAENGIAPALNSRTFPRISYALFAELVRRTSARNKLSPDHAPPHL